MATFSEEVIADAPSFWARFHELTGISANDEQGGLAGTYAAGYTLGQPGGVYGSTSVLLNSVTNGRITFPDSDAVGSGTSFTLEIIFKLAAFTSGIAMLLSKGTTTNGMYMSLNNGFVEVGKDGVQVIGQVAGPQITDTTTWHHVVWGKLNSQNIIVVDGVNVTPTITSTSIANTNMALNIGRSPSGDRYLDAYIDEVVIYDGRMLTEARIVAHYAAIPNAPSISTSSDPFGVAGVFGL